MPDTRPDTHFDETGQCSACSAYQRRPMIDWDARKQDLLDLLERHDGCCIVPSSGGKDSHYQVLTLLELGAKPIVVTASTCMLTDVGRANITNLARYVETIELTPDRRQRAKLNRLGLEMVGDISWPEHAAIFSVPFAMAVALKRPLLFYGENPQDAYGGPPGSEEARVMTMRWVSEFGGFNGLRPSDMELMAGDMRYYQPPTLSSLEEIGVEAHFLGQYVPWDSERNARVAIEAGMRVRQLEPDTATMLGRMTSPCRANWWCAENLDNAMTGLHDHFMYRKFGFGRGCQQISVDVRAGRISRAEALDWVRAHDGLFPYDYMDVPVEDVLFHIAVTKHQLYEALDQFTNWDIFERHKHHPDVMPELKVA